MEVKINFQSRHKPLFIYFSLLLDEKCEWKNAKPGQTTWHFLFCHRTILILLSINNEIAFTGNSFLHNGYPAWSRAVETEGVSLPPRDNHRLHPPTWLCCALYHMVQKDEAQVHCLRNHARPVCSAQQRKLICNLQWRQLNLSLLPLKSSSAQSCFICFGGETKPVFWDSMQITFWYKM